jgi:hydroxymethylpyrimidine/phosphomethylpyrimidine kinase
MIHSPPQAVLTIAGFDPSSGAGATADLKTIAAHGLFGTAVLTALTVQSTQGVSRWQPVEAGLVAEMLESLADDMPPAAVKIGMLGSAEVARTVADFLRFRRLKNVVVDPVLRSSSGAELVDREALDILRDHLIPLSDVVTPNLAEASLLSCIQVNDLESMQESARLLVERGARNVVVTGGHLHQPSDLLAQGEGGSISFHSYPGEHIATSNTHGTGCAFSTALACNLALGASVTDAVQKAKTYVAEALRNSYAIGKGMAPINHFHGWKK